MIDWGEGEGTKFEFGGGWVGAADPHEVGETDCCSIVVEVGELLDVGKSENCAFFCGSGLQFVPGIIGREDFRCPSGRGSASGFIGKEKFRCASGRGETGSLSCLPSVSCTFIGADSLSFANPDLDHRFLRGYIRGSLNDKVVALLFRLIVILSEAE